MCIYIKYTNVPGLNKEAKLVVFLKAGQQYHNKNRVVGRTNRTTIWTQKKTQTKNWRKKTKLQT